MKLVDARMQGYRLWVVSAVSLLLLTAGVVLIVWAGVEEPDAPWWVSVALLAGLGLYLYIASVLVQRTGVRREWRFELTNEADFALEVTLRAAHLFRWKWVVLPDGSEIASGQLGLRETDMDFTLETDGSHSATASLRAEYKAKFLSWRYPPKAMFLTIDGEQVGKVKLTEHWLLGR